MEQKHIELLKKYINENEISFLLESEVECFVSDLKEYGVFDNIKCWYDCGYTQGSGACFDADVDVENLLKYLNSNMTLSDKDFRNAMRLKDYMTASINKTSYSNHYCHENTRTLDVFVECYKNVGKHTEDLILRIEKLAEEMRLDLCRDLYSKLCAQIEYFWDDKHVIEYANEINLKVVTKEIEVAAVVED